MNVYNASCCVCVCVVLWQRADLSTESRFTTPKKPRGSVRDSFSGTADRQRVELSVFRMPPVYIWLSVVRDGDQSRFISAPACHWRRRWLVALTGSVWWELYARLLALCVVWCGVYSCLRQRGHVFVVVCLFVSNFAQKLPNGFAWNFHERLAMGQWLND